MTNDETRDTKSPDRQDESPALRLHELSIAERLEAIDLITRSLLRNIHHPQQTRLEHATLKTRTDARAYVLEIRAQVSQLGITVIGPEASIPYRPADDLGPDLNPDSDSDPNEAGSPPGYTSSIVTTYSGPEPEALEYEDARWRCGADGDGEGESDDDGDGDGDDDLDADVDETDVGVADPNSDVADPNSDADPSSDTDPNSDTDETDVDADDPHRDDDATDAGGDADAR